MVLIHERSKLRLRNAHKRDPLGRKTYMAVVPVSTDMLEGGSVRDLLRGAQRQVRGGVRKLRKSLPFIGRQALANILPLLTNSLLDKVDASDQVRRVAQSASSLAQKELRRDNRNHKPNSKLESKASEFISNESKKLLGSLLGNGVSLIGNGGFQNVTVRRE